MSLETICLWKDVLDNGNSFKDRDKTTLPCYICKGDGKNCLSGGYAEIENPVYKSKSLNSSKP